MLEWVMILILALFKHTLKQLICIISSYYQELSKLIKEKEFYLKRYNKGSDEFYYHEIIHYDTFPNICPSIKNLLEIKEVENINYRNYSICTLGQMHHLLEKGWKGWYSNYLLER